MARNNEDKNNYCNGFSPRVLEEPIPRHPTEWFIWVEKMDCHGYLSVDYGCEMPTKLVINNVTYLKQ